VAQAKSQTTSTTTSLSDRIYWLPQEGPQSLAVVCPADVIFYGGARGGGKSDTAIGRHVIGGLTYQHQWNGLFIRKRYKDFKEIRRRIKELIREGLPAQLIGGDSQANTLVFDNGAQVQLVSVQYEEQLDAFQGQQFCEVSIEEGGQFSFVDNMIEKLKGCLRSPHGVPCHIFITANPGGPGHSQLKVRFVAPAPQGGVPIREHDGDVAVYIPARVDDNKILMQNDPKYKQRLESIRDPNLRRMWLEGDWDAVAGGFFADVWRPDRHILPRFRPPDHWDRLVGFDWGSFRPFSLGWFAISGGDFVPELGRALPRGALIRFWEWYGCVKGRANEGIRLESPKVAEQILLLEDKYRLLGNVIPDRIADPAIFTRSDGPSTSEKMADQGVVWRKGDNKRIPGWDVMRHLLRGRGDFSLSIDDEGLYDSDGINFEPMFYVTENCTEWIRTVPILERDLHDIEDVDSDGEDHAADETRYVIMSRFGKGTSLGDLPVKRTAMELEHDFISASVVDEDEYMELPAATDGEVDFLQKGRFFD
jgi:hypothetical protein